MAMAGPKSITNQAAVPQLYMPGPLGTIPRQSSWRPNSRKEQLVWSNTPCIALCLLSSLTVPYFNAEENKLILCNQQS